MYIFGLRAIESEETKELNLKVSARLRARHYRYSIYQFLLCYPTDTEDTPRTVVLCDEVLAYRIPYKAHDAIFSGHLGREVPITRLKSELLVVQNL